MDFTGEVYRDRPSFGYFPNTAGWETLVQKNAFNEKSSQEKATRGLCSAFHLS
jgi:hypothetical protein